jgi:Tol biopolymer transport system component
LITGFGTSVMFANWSGDGKEITFSANLGNAKNDVYSVNADGGKLVNITKDGKKDQYFSSTSQDGKILLFDSADWATGFQIFAMDINGENRRQLSQRH